MKTKQVLSIKDIQLVNDTIATKILGYKIYGFQYVKDGAYPINRREFNPLSDFRDAFKIVTAITKNTDIYYRIAKYGNGHECVIDNEGKQLISRKTALTPEVAICLAGLDFVGITLDIPEPTFEELKGK